MKFSTMNKTICITGRKKRSFARLLITRNSWSAMKSMMETKYLIRQKDLQILDLKLENKYNASLFSVLPMHTLLSLFILLFAECWLVLGSEIWKSKLEYEPYVISKGQGQIVNKAAMGRDKHTDKMQPLQMYQHTFCML